MTPAQLARVAMVLGALLLLWGAVSLTRRGSGGLSESDRFNMPPIVRDSTDSVIILRAADTTRLARRDSAAWTVNGHPVAMGAVAELFAALGDSTRRTELVGARPASHAGFGVDSTKGVRIRIVRGDSTLADLVQGNRDPGLDGGYFRAAADSAVYLVGGNLAQVLEKSSDEWRDRQIAGVSVDSVARIEITRGKRTYRLDRDEHRLEADSWRTRRQRRRGRAARQLPPGGRGGFRLRGAGRFGEFRARRAACGPASRGRHPTGGTDLRLDRQRVLGEGGEGQRGLSGGYLVGGSARAGR